jgi:cytochrome c
MKKNILMTVVLITGLCVNVFGQDAVTPKELFDKVGEAMVFIMENGEAGVQAMSEKAADNPFIWKDTYVFVFQCPKQVIVAHPNPKLINNKAVWKLKDPKGKLIMQTLCEVATNAENGGWFDYYWPKKQTKKSKTTVEKLGDTETLARKVTFSIQVPGTPYQVAAGIYDDSLSVDELNANIESWMK